MQQSGIGAAAVLTGAFALLHFVVTIAGRPSSSGAGAPDGEPPSTDAAARRIELLGEELQKRLVDEEAPSRDVTKHYVTIAGVSLTLLVALSEGGPGVEIFVGATSLGVSIAAGLILLERLSGSTLVDFGHYAISIMYHVMSWSLLFGLLSILASLWIPETRCD